MINNLGYREACSSCELKALREGKVQLQFLHVLQEIAAIESTDPRNQLYGLLGLTHDSTILVPNPNYRASVSSIFAGLVQNHIRHHNGLDIICYERPPQQRTDLPFCPFWVPNWTKRASEAFFIVGLGFSPLHYQACKAAGQIKGDYPPIPHKASLDLPLDIEFLPGLTTLTCSEILLDYVDGLCFASVWQGQKTLAINLIQSRSMYQINPTIEYEAHKVKALLIHTLIMDRNEY
jgi:hypothetical protein